MSLGVFDTHLGAQGMEGIGEIQNYLAPLLPLIWIIFGTK
jgi:hypothetical protein